MNAIRRTISLGLLLFGGLVAMTVAASAASAHTLGAGVAAMNYRTTLVTVSPTVPGVRFRVVDDGLHVIATNQTATPLVILGYAGEPYLRVDAGGVWENLRSPATYLNRNFLPGTVPAIADANAVPRWHRLSGSDSVIWHDHRLHWMATSPPTQVQVDPHRFNLISVWQISARYGARPLMVSGTLSWVPGPSPAGWLAGLGVVGFATAAVLVLSRRRSWLPAAMVTLVAADVTRSLGLVAGRGGPLWLRLEALPWHGAAQLVLWLLVLAAASLDRRRRLLAAYVAVFAGVAVLMLGGLVSLAALWQSQVIAWQPWWLERALIVLTVGVAGGLAVGAMVRLHRLSRRPVGRIAMATGLTLLTSACGGGSAAPSAPVVLHVATVRSLGPVLESAKGYVLYVFAPDKRHSVTCQQICAGTWPPVAVSGRQQLTAGAGVEQRLLGSDPNPGGGRVATYDGWPLYAYVGDVSPGLVNGQALNLNGGLWYVISPSGTVIKKRVT